MIPLIPTKVTKQNTFSHRLALIHFKDPTNDDPLDKEKGLKFSTHIRPICLADFEKFSEGSSVTVIGSGFNWLSTNKGESKVLKAEITVRNSSKCNNFTELNQDRIVCAGEAFVGIREGDEGAPLLVFYQKRFYLIAIFYLPGIAPLCNQLIHNHTNVRCISNVIPIESTKKKFSCGAVLEPSSRRQRAIGKDLQHLQPWYCKVYIQDLEQCSGTLISYKHVLTVAHCLRDTKFDDCSIHCGIGFESISKIAKVRNHSDFKEGNLENDIAVIELENEIDFDGNVGAACLTKDDEIINKNSDLIAVGNDLGIPKTAISIELKASGSANCQA
uniref:Peptidase S1 domain-containing protein n=1 Tax=Panagrolaimus davidi TaxID=227884 RepID=A0A914QWH4_9BILA